MDLVGRLVKEQRSTRITVRERCVGLGTELTSNRKQRPIQCCGPLIERHVSCYESEGEQRRKDYRASSAAPTVTLDARVEKGAGLIA